MAKTRTKVRQVQSRETNFLPSGERPPSGSGLYCLGDISTSLSKKIMKETNSKCSPLLNVPSSQTFRSELVLRQAAFYQLLDKRRPKFPARRPRGIWRMGCLQSARPFGRKNQHDLGPEQRGGQVHQSDL